MIKELGAGGMGVVYLARDPLTNTRVAVKTAGRADPTLHASIRHEIRGLDRLRHPGVLRVIASGEDHNAPWMAMEYVDARTLQDVLRTQWHPDVKFDGPVDDTLATAEVDAAVDEPAAPPRPLAPETLREVIALARRLCDVLHYVHTQGVVHRDLKPSNVFIRDDGQPVLVDFGIVSRAPGHDGREVIQVEGDLVGTVGYMAPEQIAGEFVDARADLYSLGCILYVCLTGRVPIEGASPYDVYQRQRQGRVVPIAARVTGVPDALSDLVARLLTADPRRRIGHARDVAAVLDRLVDAAPDVDAAQTPLLFRPSLVGRQQAFRALVSRLESTAVGKGGGLVILTGESGSGKTRLAAEVARAAVHLGCQVIVGDCVPIDASSGSALRGAPLHPFRELLRRVGDLGMHDDQALARRVAAHAALLAPYEPALQALQARMQVPEPVSVPPDAARQRLVAGVRSMVGAYATGRSLLLVIDDIQWADELSLSVLGAFCDGADLRDVLVLVTCRSGELPPAAARWEERGAGRVSLERLDEPAVRAVVAEMLGWDAPSPRLAHLIAARAEGNPFVVGEYLHAALRLGVVVRDGEGWRLADDAVARLPIDHRALLLARLEGLDVAQRSLLDAAAVLGREFERDDLAALLSSEPLDVDAQLMSLQRQRVVHPDTADRWRFAHDRLREAALARIEPTWRRALHLRAAQRIEGALPDFAAIPLLAYHWTQAGVSQKALDALVRAARQALRAGAPRQAATLVDQALALRHEALPHLDSEPRRRERAELDALRADAYWGLGDTARSIDHTVRALRELGIDPPSSRAGWLLRGVRELVELPVHQLLPGALRRPEHMLRNRDGAQLAEKLCANVMSEHDLARALVASMMAANLADRSGPETFRAQSYGILGATFGFVGFAPLARWYFARGWAHAEAHHDVSGAVGLLVMESAYAYSRADWGLLDARIEDAVRRAREARDHTSWDTALIMKAAGLLARGRSHGLLADLDAVRISSGAREHVLLIAWADSHEAEYRLWRGELAAARMLSARSLPVMRERAGTAAVVSLATLARAQWLDGDRAAATDHALEALALLEREPPQFSLNRGGALVADTLLARLRRERSHSARRDAERAVRIVRGMARSYPVAIDASLRVRAELSTLSGRHREAVGLLRAAARRAATKGHGHQEFLTELAMARCEAAPEWERRSAAQHARAQMDALGWVDPDADDTAT